MYCQCFHLFSYSRLDPEISTLLSILPTKQVPVLAIFQFFTVTITVIINCFVILFLSYPLHAQVNIYSIAQLYIISSYVRSTSWWRKVFFHHS